jgi:hypothetical protein
VYDVGALVLCIAIGGAVLFSENLIILGKTCVKEKMSLMTAYRREEI